MILKTSSGKELKFIGGIGEGTKLVIKVDDKDIAEVLLNVMETKALKAAL